MSLVRFEPVRNLQKLWSASGDFWQLKWNQFLDITGEDQKNLN